MGEILVDGTLLRTTTSAQPVVVSSPATVDTFVRADGLLGNGWTDLGALFPSSATVKGFDPAGINGSTAGVRSAATFPGHNNQLVTLAGTPNSTLGVGNVAAFRSLSRTDGVEVGVWWLTDPPVAPGGPEPTAAERADHKLHQVGPATHVTDSATADAKQVGLKNCWDVSLSPAAPLFICHGLFRSVTDRIFDQVHHDFYDANWHVMPLAQFIDQRRVFVSIRAYGGRIEGRVDGHRVWGPIDVPDWAAGRDGWGFSNVDIIKQTLPGGGVDHHARIAPWSARPWTTSLGAYPAPVDVAAGATATSAGTSIAVPYPSGLQRGDRVSIVLACRGGGAAITAPSGFQKTASDWMTSPGDTVTLAVLDADGPADGPMTGTETVAVAGPAAAFMIRSRGANPVAPGGLAGFNNPYYPAMQSGTSATPSTRRAFPLGPDRRIGWLVAIDADVDINPPSGFDLTARTRTGGGIGVSIALATRVYPTSSTPGDKVFNPPFNPVVARDNPDPLLAGTVSGSGTCNWVGAVGSFNQDPR